jgi:hypothetical protein
VYVAGVVQTFFWERGLRAVGRCEMPARHDSAYTPLLVRTNASSDDSAWRAAHKQSGPAHHATAVSKAGSMILRPAIRGGSTAGGCAQAVFTPPCKCSCD